MMSLQLSLSTLDTNLSSVDTQLSTLGALSSSHLGLHHGSTVPAQDHWHTLDTLSTSWEGCQTHGNTLDTVSSLWQADWLGDDQRNTFPASR